MFKIFDRNHDDYISVKEFIIGYALSNTNDAEKKLDYTFALFDIDGNNYLTTFEIIQAIDIVLQFQEKKDKSYDIETIRRTFERLDTSKDGKISKSKKIVLY
jgi:Ca2+-binding EF-hand superfamily protein